MNRLALTLLALAPLAPLAAGAQAKTEVLDRKKIPALGKTPVLKLPTVEWEALQNGVSIQLVGQHEVPLVQVTLIISGGSRLDASQPVGESSDEIASTLRELRANRRVVEVPHTRTCSAPREAEGWRGHR